MSESLERKNMYQIISENLTNLGGPMGSEYTTNNWIKHAKSLKKAKKFCEKDCGEKIKWIKTKKGLRSPDLGYVMYHIKEIKMID